MWYLVHFNKTTRMPCESHRDAISRFNHMPKNADGVIPWTIMYIPEK
jgi:hypothetical protein